MIKMDSKAQLTVDIIAKVAEGKIGYFTFPIVSPRDVMPAGESLPPAQAACCIRQ